MDPKIEMADPGSSSPEPKQIDPAALTQQPTPSGAPLDVLEMAGPSALKTTEAKTMDKSLKEDLASGKLSQTAYDAAMKDSGLDVVMADTRTPPQVEFDKINPAGKPDQFIFQYDPNVRMTPEQRGMDAQMRAALSASGFPAEVGSSLAREIRRSAIEHRAMSDAQTHAHKMKVESQLRQLWGDKADANVKVAAQFYQDMKKNHMTVAEVLEASLSLNSARVIVAFYDAAMLRAERNGGK